MTRRGEISKRPFKHEQEAKHYESLSMQMGRVQLDADWNEAFETLLRARERVTRDVIGKEGSPNEGFRTDTALILDHMESKKDWTPMAACAWQIDYFEKTEGKGSFRIDGNATLSRPIPLLLRKLNDLRQVLLDRGAQTAPVKLRVYCKVSAADSSTITLKLDKGDGKFIVSKLETIACEEWQKIEISDFLQDLSACEAIIVQIATTGTVYLDCLELDAGVIPDFSKDFYIQGGEGSSETAGRYYVDGLASAKEGFETYKFQKDYPDPKDITIGTDKQLVYLDVWKKTVTAVEDPDILEEALGGLDTCTREQLVSQVKVTTAACEDDIWNKLRPGKTGTLTAKLSPKAEQDKCDFRPELDYTGLNNSLYRVEIHIPGNAGSAWFKWSRNNGADVVPVTKFSGPDSVIVPDDRLLCCGNIVELCDDVSDLADFADTAKHGKMATITDIEHIGEEGVKVTLDFSIDDASGRKMTDFSSRKTQENPVRHPKLRKWHGFADVKSYPAVKNQIPEMELEHGIKLGFSADGAYYHGDFWQFTARVNTRSIEELEDAFPMGPVHHYAPLAEVQLQNEVSFTSCRKVFPPLTDLEASGIGFDADSCALLKDLNVKNVQQAIEALCRMKGYDRIVLPGQSIRDAIKALGPEGGSIYLAPGLHIVTETVIIQDKTNITISGDGSATRVVYIPEEAAQEQQDVQQLETSIKQKNSEIEQEQDPVKKKDLIDQLAPLEIQLEEKLEAQLRDLFRITGSEGITLRDFLMLSFGADSLVAVLDNSRNVTVSASEVWNLPVSVGAGQMMKAVLLKNEALTGTSAMPCIRATDCCELIIEGNTMLGNIGFLQQGGPDVSKMPVVNGFRFVKNRLFVLDAALSLLEGTRVIIEDNVVQAIDQDSAAALADLNSIAVGEIPDNDCLPQNEQTIEQIVSQIIEVTSRCVPDPVNAGGILGRAFILRDSRIENNVFGGDEALALTYSEENLIAKNRIISDTCGLLMVYSFRTNVTDNVFIRTSPSASVQAASQPAPAAAVDQSMKYGYYAESIRDTNLDSINSALYSELAAVMMHFADRLIFTGNKVTGQNGFAVKPMIKEDVIDSITGFSQYMGAGQYSTGLDGAVSLAKRFAQVMGLGPAITLIEKVLKLYSGGQDLDLVGILVRPQDEIPGKIPLLPLIVKLLDALLSLSAISRCVISRNEFAVDRYGIKKIQGPDLLGRGSDISLTLGGVEITDNRITGAEDTAILWKSCALLSNPDLNGVLLSCGYQGVLRALKLIRGMFKKIIEQTEFTGEATPLNIFILTTAFYTVGHKCLQQTGTTAPGTGTTAPGTNTTPDNPYAGIMKEIVDAIGDVIDQLVDESVRQNVSDLSRSADRISLNQIRGRGNGIHTNIANCIIESNRVDIEPGTSAIAELFAMGRQFAANAALINYRNYFPNSDGIDRPALASLGNALMNLNPDAVEAAGEMLDDAPQQWTNLGTMLDTIMQFIDSSSSATKPLYDLLTALKTAVASANTDSIKSASDDLIKEAQSQLTGYGIIVESPGVHVVDNRIETITSCCGNSGARTAPGGILMTGGKRGILNMLTYFLLFEEIESIENINIGGQGTVFRNNSIQSGAGHGLSLSALPLMIDVSIENNEIQNHGLSGILCDRPTLLASVQAPLVYNKAFFKKSMPTNAPGTKGTLGLLPSFLPYLYFLYKLRITDNEINQCFLNEALGFVPGEPYQTVEYIKGILWITMAPATILGGLTVRNAAEVTCSRNTIRACGANEKTWPCTGSLLINCWNVRYADNEILGNGKEEQTAVYEPYCPHGGALFLGGVGNLGITDNEFSDNTPITSLVAANYEIVDKLEYKTTKITITQLAPAYESWSLGRLLVQGNDFELDESGLSGWSKINMGNKEQVDTINVLNFAGNSIELPESVTQNGITLAADRLLFNGNAATGVNENNVELFSNKGIGTGNNLDAKPSSTGVYITEDPNNQHNRLQ